MDGGAWWAAVHEVAKSQTRLNDLTLTFHFHALEKEMATHSSVLVNHHRSEGAPAGLAASKLHFTNFPLTCSCLGEEVLAWTRHRQISLIQRFYKGRMERRRMDDY